jgi:hypothetical protein
MFNKLKKLVENFGTLNKLGLSNVIRVAWYKFSIQIKLNRVFFIKTEPITGEIYDNPKAYNGQLPNVDCWEKQEFFNSYFKLKIQEQAPDWFYSYYTGKISKGTDRMWSKIPDFDPELGDIKPLWDLSRFDWIIPLSQQAKKGEIKAFSILNNWLEDWVKKNPPYYGVNWKCGQEASIRVIHLIMSAYLLDQHKTPKKALLQLIIAHLKRIEPTISYAIGQNNNHGTSEAAALFIGGSFLSFNGYKIGKKWQDKGEKVLINRTSTLIDNTGTFSQYSLNYHRLLIDTLCCCEFFRKEFSVPEFATVFYEKARLAVNWLFAIIDVQSGSGPNVGANDGARIIPLSNCGYRDFRPSVQLAMHLFNGKRAYSAGIWDEPLYWLHIQSADNQIEYPITLIAKEGGYAILRKSRDFVLLRFPKYKFRPSQNDSLHVDLWVNGKNLLRDGGSYSYNADTSLMNYFGSTAAHNTIQFDNREPMPKISRFLYGDWLETNWMQDVENVDDVLSFGAGYTDRIGASHKRRINFATNKLEVIDEIAGFKNNAILRWRLINDDWILHKDSNSIRLFSEKQNITIQVQSSAEIILANKSIGYESELYLQYSELNVLEITVQEEGTLITTINW